MIVTGQTVVSNALTILGILGPGEIPSASDSQTSLDELNAMWDGWATDEGLVFAQIAERFPLTAGLGIYTIGTPPAGAVVLPNINQPFPSRIVGARVITVTGGAPTASSIGDPGTGYAVNDTGVVLGASGTNSTYVVNAVNAQGGVTNVTLMGGTGYSAGNGKQTQTAGGQPGSGIGLTVNITTVSAEGQTRTDLNIVSAPTYFGHRDLSASSLTPDELYPDFNPDQDGFMRLHLWPVPNQNVTSTCEIDINVNFSQWSLTGSYTLNWGYLDALQYVLAYRLAARFGALVNPATLQQIGGLAMKAEERLRQMNTINRKLPEGAAATPQVTPPPQQQPAGR